VRSFMSLSEIEVLFYSNYTMETGCVMKRINYIKQCQGIVRNDLGVRYMHIRRKAMNSMVFWIISSTTRPL
jgi:hypothetical protein